MNLSPPPLPTCVNCQTTLDPNGTCPRCRAPEDWNDQIEALDFVLRRLKEWHQKGQLTDRQMQTFEESYGQRRQAMSAAGAARETFRCDNTFSRRDECWSCKEYLYTSASHCHSCGAPVTDPGVRSLRYWEYLHRELVKHEDTGGITLRQGHELLADTRERIEALRRKLERDRAPFVLPVVEEAKPAPRRRQSEEPTLVVPQEPGRSFLEILLDPNSIRWLLAAGGALIVLGLIIWLTSLGLFDNPGVIAVLLGLGNAALLAGGWALILRTRFQHAGLALTLLACLVMPLNLWFYHTHNLITLENNLWVAALVCCAVYVASALLLRDALFVYVLVAGVTLTGLLFLAQVNHFGEVFAPTIFFITLGMIALHAERAFPPGEGPFARERFGMASYWSSQALFAVGLLLLLGAQIIGWLHDPFFKFFGMANPPDVSRQDFLPYTLAIVLVGTYAYIYSDLVVRKVGVYLYLAAITVFWAEIHVLVLIAPADKEAVIIITLALTALVLNVLNTAFQGKYEVLRVVSPLGLLLSFMAVGFGGMLHLRATNFILHGALERIWPFEITWPLAISIGMTAACCRAGAFLYRHRFKEISVIYFFLTAAATLVGAAELAWLLGLKAWELEAPFVMLIPIVYLIATYLYRGHTAEKPLLWAAHAATVVMLLCSLWAAVMPQVVARVEGAPYNLLLAAFCFEAAIFYLLAGILHRAQISLYMAAVMLCGAVWQVLISLNLPNEFYPIVFSVLGFILAVLYRAGVFEKLEMPMLERGVFQSANGLMTMGFAAGAILSLSRVFLSQDALARLDVANPPFGDWRNPIRILVYLLVFLSVISLAAAWLVQHPAWRRTYLVLSIVNGILLVLLIHRLNTLSPWQKLEIISIVVGLVLLVIGYVGWYRETEKSSDLISFALFIGAACVVVPFLIGTIYYRWFRLDELGRPAHIHTPRWDDLGLVVSCVLLFGSGVLCRLKATTLIGVAGMIAYIFVILISLIGHLPEQYMVGVYLTIGGGVLFGTGLILSMYRDRLLTLPDRIKRREGIFRFFDWR